MKPRTLFLSLTLAVIGATLVAACTGGTTPDPFRLCGNGVVEPGEQCDDGDSNSDLGACLTTCQTAFCGDRFVYAAKEQCDTNNFGYPDARDPQTCKKLGFDGGTLLCTANCRIDTSQCGPAFTPVATAAQTSTPTSTSTPTPATRCGDGLIEDGETCEQCAADCTVRPCSASASTTFTFTFASPLGQDATSVTLLVGYRSDILSIPGSGLGSCQGGGNNGLACSKAADCPDGQCIQPRSRIKNTPPSSIVSVNDLDYGARVVVTRSPIPAGRLFTVDFDMCTGSPPATASDVSCIVTGCATGFGPLDGCTCTVSGP